MEDFYKHQPVAGPVLREDKTNEQYEKICGNFIALICAHDVLTTPLTIAFEEDPNREEQQKPITLEKAPRPLQVYNDMPVIFYALEAAIKAHVKAIYILVHPQIKDQVDNVVQSLSTTKQLASYEIPPIKLIDYDKDADIEKARDAAWFDCFDLSYSVIDTARTCIMNDSQASHIIVMRSDMVRITHNHLYEICNDALVKSKTEIISSWITWLSRAPFIFKRSFLEDLPQSFLMEKSKTGFRPLPNIEEYDHVFGEEVLFANDTVPDNIADFQQKVSLSALQAIKLARKHLEDPDNNPLCDPNIAPPMIGPAIDVPLSKEDLLLEQCAEKILQQVSEYETELEAQEKEELFWADEFGKRNKFDFPQLMDSKHKDKLAYLDSAATTMRLGAALDAQDHFDRHENANVYRGAYELSARATSSFNKARKRLEDFINADKRQTIYTSNTTASCNLVARDWGEHNISEGDQVIVILGEHHSDMLPFMMLCARKKAKLTYISIVENGRIDMGAFEQALQEGTQLVCVAHIANMTGMIAPVKKITELAKEHGARVLIDAAQSFAHEKIDVKEMGADFVAFSAHKAYGPLGLGGLWVSDEAFAEMDPLGSGGGAVSHVGMHTYYLRQKSVQYELGTPPVSQAIGFARAIDYLDELGMDNIATHSRALTRLLADGLSNIDGISIWGDKSKDDGLSGLLSFSLYGVTPSQLAKLLGKCQVAIRSGGHCALPLHERMALNGTGRVSLGVYTSKDDILALLCAVEACRRLYWGEVNFDEEPDKESDKE